MSLAVEYNQSSIFVDYNAVASLPSTDAWLLSSTLTVFAQVSILSIVANGYNCTAATGTLSFFGGGGTGAAGTYSVIGGSVYLVNLLSGGKFYVSSPSVTLSDPTCLGVLISATLSLDSTLSGSTRQVVAYTSTNRGVQALMADEILIPQGLLSNYRINPVTSLGGTLSVEAQVPSLTSIILDTLSVSSLSWYLSTIAGSGSGSATASYVGRSVVFSTSLNSLSLTSAVVGLNITLTGVDCSSVSGSLTFTGGGGSGASGTYTIQNGGLTTVVLTSGGSGYTAVPVITLSTLYGCISVPTVTALIGNGGNGNPNCSSGSLLFSGGNGTGASGSYTAIGGVILSLIHI